jgi:hypothetical protein
MPAETDEERIAAAKAYIEALVAEIVIEAEKLKRLSQPRPILPLYRDD